MLKLGLYFCVDFLASSELRGYVDLTDSYEIWPKCSLGINAQKCVRLFWFSKYFFHALSCDEDQQIECVRCHAVKYKIKNYATDKVKKL